MRVGPDDRPDRGRGSFAGDVRREPAPASTRRRRKSLVREVLHVLPWPRRWTRFRRLSRQRQARRSPDLRERNNGIFPAVEWIAVVEHVDLSSPHADVWERIRTDQEGTSGQGAVARGIVASIADYIISVQTK